MACVCVHTLAHMCVSVCVCFWGREAFACEECTQQTQAHPMCKPCPPNIPHTQTVTDILTVSPTPSNTQLASCHHAQHCLHCHTHPAYSTSQHTQTHPSLATGQPHKLRHTQLFKHTHTHSLTFNSHTCTRTQFYTRTHTAPHTDTVPPTCSPGRTYSTMPLPGSQRLHSPLSFTFPLIHPWVLKALAWGYWESHSAASSDTLRPVCGPGGTN